MKRSIRMSAATLLGLAAIGMVSAGSQAAGSTRTSAAAARFQSPNQDPSGTTGTTGIAGTSGTSGASGTTANTAPPVTGPPPVVPLENQWGVRLTPLPGSLVLNMEADPSMAAPGPYVALTFDDGPSKFTQAILDILRNEDVPATFFMLSENARNRPEDAKAVKAAGHHVAAHTVTHRDLATISPEDAFDEINRSVDEINEIVGAGTVRCLRPPYGSYDDTVLNIAASRGIGVMNWDVDTNDWNRPGSDAIHRRATNISKASIILMHDGGGPRQQTVDALPLIIRDLKAKNAKFVAVC